MAASKRPSRKRKASSVREPIQVYLTAEERARLDRLASEHGLSRAEVLRRGIRSFAVEHAKGASAVLDFLEEMKGGDWPRDVATHHDEHLADSHDTTTCDDE